MQHERRCTSRRLAHSSNAADRTKALSQVGFLEFECINKWTGLNADPCLANILVEVTRSHRSARCDCAPPPHYDHPCTPVVSGWQCVSRVRGCSVLDAIRGMLWPTWALVYETICRELTRAGYRGTVTGWTATVCLDSVRVAYIWLVRVLLLGTLYLYKSCDQRGTS